MIANAVGRRVERYRRGNIHRAEYHRTGADMDLFRELYRVPAGLCPALLVRSVAFLLFYPGRQRIRKAAAVLSIPTEYGVLVRVFGGEDQGAYDGLGEDPNGSEVPVRFQSSVTF